MSPELLESLSNADSERKRWLHVYRNKILTLDEILSISESYYGDQKFLALYGLNAPSFYHAGVRLVGRTAIECKVDLHAIAIARMTSAFFSAFSATQRPIVLDLFAGSGNLLFHVAQQLRAAQAIGIEVDPSIHELTSSNFRAISFSGKVLLGNYKQLVPEISLAENTPVVILIDPPWGDGFNHHDGLDLLRTEPPVHEIISYMQTTFPQHQLFFVIPTHSRLVQESLDAVCEPFIYSYFGEIKAIGLSMDLSCLVCSQG